MASKQRKMPASAKYQVHIPTHDDHHNLLHDLSTVSHQWLQNKIPRLIHSVHTDGPVRGGVNGPDETHHRMSILGVDSPEVDSHVKQLAAHVGQLANKHSLLVSKEGSDGPQVWHVTNNTYDGGPAHPDAIKFPAILSPSAPQTPVDGESPVDPPGSPPAV